jgi:predicted PurR-regulated permease PerM
VSDSTFYSRTFALLALALIAYLLYQIMLPFLAPAAWALFIAFLLQPTHRWLGRKLGNRPAVSATLLTIAAFLIVIGPLAALGTAFVTQVAELVRYAQDFAAEHKGEEFSALAEVPVIGPAIQWLQEATGLSLAQIQAWALQAARAVLGALAALGKMAFVGALGTVIGFVLMIFILFFAIRDGREMFADLRALVPMTEAERARLFDHLGSVLRAMVYGTGVTALVQGALVAIAFAIVGLPSPVVFGVLAALFALIPMMGTPIVWVPAAIMLAADGRTGAALFMAIWGVGVTVLDNFLRPLLVSGRAQVGTLTVFMGVLGGVSAFGPIGIFLGPLVLALVIALFRFVLEMRSAHAAGR